MEPAASSPPESVDKSAIEYGAAGGRLDSGIGNVTLPITGHFELSGIAFGTIIVIVLYHLGTGLQRGTADQEDAPSANQRELSSEPSPV